MPTVIYGIKNCDTVKKALKWLEAEGIAHQYHDFRQNGLSTSKLDTWLNVVGANDLINRRSTSWKQLSEKEREQIDAGDGKLLILGTPTLIKRPVLEHNGRIYCGFKPDLYSSIFN